MKKVSGRRSSDDSKIDLTPMLDVVFILLIFFVVTATFLSETALNAASSQGEDEPPPPEDDKRNILFEIGANNEIILNGNPRPIVETQIRSNIDQLRAENPEATVIIQPDLLSDVETLVMIMDAARQAGIFDISIVDPED